MGNDVIFEPLKWRNIEIKNRIFRSSISGRLDNEDGGLPQTRINWESKFARGGIGAIISSFVPVSWKAASLPDTPPFIPTISSRCGAGSARRCTVTAASTSCSSATRAGSRTCPAWQNENRRTRSSTSRNEMLHGFLMPGDDRKRSTRPLMPSPPAPAVRSRRGLTASSCTAPTATLSPSSSAPASTTGRTSMAVTCESRALPAGDHPGDPPELSASDFHLQVKISGIDYNNVIPWEGKGNTLQDSIQLARWSSRRVPMRCTSRSAACSRILSTRPAASLSTPSRATMTRMLASGHVHASQLLPFRYPAVAADLPLDMVPYEMGRPVEGVGIDQCRAIKQAVKIPVISTGG